jgi:hypothetical protein
MKISKVESLLGQKVRDFNGEFGFIDCPGREKHTSKNGPKDTIIYLNEAPYIHCFHHSCLEIRDCVSSYLCSELGEARGTFADFKLGASKELEKKVETNRKHAINWFVSKIRPFNQKIPVSSTCFLSIMFNLRDLVWIGNPEHTGSRFKNHFRIVEQWVARPPAPDWRFVCASVFKPGSTDRILANAELRYLVLESDSLSQEDTRALFEAVSLWDELVLKAIVFSGNRSLHGWFIHPGLDWLNRHKHHLEGLGFDLATTRPSQPVRLPGVIRENGKRQELMWL